MGCASSKPAEGHQGNGHATNGHSNGNSNGHSNGDDMPSRSLSKTQLADELWSLSLSEEEQEKAQAENAEAAELGNTTFSKLIADNRLNGEVFVRGCKTEEDPDKLLVFKEKSKSKTSLGEDVISDVESLEAVGLGCTCRKGLKPQSPNQDAFVVCRVDDHPAYSIYGVFDGHGEHGHSVAEYANELLPKLLLRDKRLNSHMFEKREEMLSEAFFKMQSFIKSATFVQSIRGEFSGTTGTVVVHDHQCETLTIANVGDSSAVLGRVMLGNDKLMAVELTEDHKPQMNQERMRIEQGGGVVKHDGHMSFRVYARGRKYPGLNMSRCLGDLASHATAGLSAVPDVLEHEVGTSDRLLLVCSDGVWTFLDPQEAIDIVSEYSAEEALKAAEDLATKAKDRWLLKENGNVVDDITVIVVFLQNEAAVPAEVEVNAI